MCRNIVLDVVDDAEGDVDGADEGEHHVQDLTDVAVPDLNKKNRVK